METNKILDTSVAIERSEGVITIFSVIEHPPCGRKNFEVIDPETIDYVKAIEISFRLREKGTPIGAINIIIAAMCLNRSATIVTRDKDFRWIKNIFSEFQLELL